MPQLAPPPKEHGPRPWPVPPTAVSREQNKFRATEETDAEDKLEKQYLAFSKPVSDDCFITAKITRAIFQKISELYPDNVRDVLSEEQISSLAIDQDESDEDDIDKRKDETIAQLDSSSVKVEKFFADKIQLGNIDVEAEVSEKENFDKRLSEQVDYEPSLQELFSDREELNSRETFIKEDAHAEEGTLSFPFAGKKSQESNQLMKEAIFKAFSPSGGVSPIPVNGSLSRGIVEEDTDVVDRDLEVISDDEEPPDFVAPIAHRVLSSDILGSSKSQIGSSGDASSHGKNTEPSSDGAKTKGKPALRRPIASRRRGVVSIPELNKQMLAAGEESRPNSTPTTPHSSTASRDTLSKSSTTPKLGHIDNTSKGVIMRTLSQHRKMAGNRRAETGVVMSREELRSTRNRDIATNPVPKSLRAWELLFNDDDGTDLESTPSPRSMEAVSRGQLSIRSGVKERKSQGAATVRSKEKRSLFSLSPTRWSPRSRRMNHGSEDKESSSRFSEVGESSGMMGRLSSGLRRATQVFGLKSGAEVVNVKSDMVIAGALDEAVCRISAVCWKKFGYRIHVRDGGRRVKVESGEDCDWNDYLQTTLVIREIKGSEAMCAIMIQSSRKDRMKTSTATLSEFYLRLEQELRADNKHW